MDMNTGFVVDPVSLPTLRTSSKQVSDPGNIFPNATFFPFRSGRSSKQMKNCELFVCRAPTSLSDRAPGVDDDVTARDVGPT